MFAKTGIIISLKLKMQHMSEINFAKVTYQCWHFEVSILLHHVSETLQ